MQDNQQETFLRVVWNPPRWLPDQITGPLMAYNVIIVDFWMFIFDYAWHSERNLNLLKVCSVCIRLSCDIVSQRLLLASVHSWSLHFHIGLLFVPRHVPLHSQLSPTRARALTNFRKPGHDRLPSASLRAVRLPTWSWSVISPCQKQRCMMACWKGKE